MLLSELEQEQKLYYQVRILYEDCEANADIPEDARELESAAIGELEKAGEIAKHAIVQIQEGLPDTKIIELELDEAEDGYHLLVVDGNEERVVGVGLTITDYTDETLH